jgi:hypothetical protein
MTTMKINVFFACCCLLLAGCGREHVWGVRGEGTVESVECDGRVFAILVLNGSWESAVDGGKVSSPTCTARGRWRAPAGRREIAWSCDTKNGTEGSVTVDGQNFDLSKGALFLVPTNETKAKVVQLAVDMSKLQGASVTERLRAMATTDARIADFLGETPAPNHSTLPAETHIENPK